LRWNTRNKRFSRVISADSSLAGHGVNAQPFSMTAVTPVAPRKARPPIDFNASPLSDRTRCLFPAIPGPQPIQISKDDAGESASLSPSPIVLLHTDDPEENSSTSSPIVAINNDDLNDDPATVLYRSTRNLPHELETHCNIYLEERLCKNPDSVGSLC